MNESKKKELEFFRDLEKDAEIIAEKLKAGLFDNKEELTEIRSNITKLEKEIEDENNIGWLGRQQ